VVLDGICGTFREYAKENARELFDRKKKSMDNLVMFSPVTESDTYGNSLKVSVPVYPKSGDFITKELKVYGPDNKELSAEEIPMGRHVSARALIHVSHGYSLNKTSYGTKLVLKTLQLMDKPEEEKELLRPFREGEEQEGSMEKNDSVSGDRMVLGNAFL